MKSTCRILNKIINCMHPVYGKNRICASAIYIKYFHVCCLCYIQSHTRLKVINCWVFFLSNKDSDKLVKGLDVMWFGVRSSKHSKLMLETTKYRLILSF